MAGRPLRVFMGGDVYGTAGLEAVARVFPEFRKREHIDFAVINGENAAGGSGLTGYEADALFSCGIDVITGGNHIFEKRELFPLFETDKRLLRPANYPDARSVCDTETPGHGFDLYEKNGAGFAVLNIQGREYMTPLDCPFAAAAFYAREAEKAGALLLIDFHAESNEEKEALGLFMDGKACAVCGTHTHVQTADGRILSNGTAYMTDLGMCGVADSVIGAKTELAVARNLTQVLYRLENAEGTAFVQGALLEIDPDSKKALSIRRINLPCRPV